MFILEVLINSQRAWPHDVDRVKYGPFDTHEEAQRFFNQGVENPDMYGVRFRPEHKVITNLTAILNDPKAGLTWGYKS